MGLDLDGAAMSEAIALANQRLGKSRVKIFRRGGTLWLRGTFPPKPHLDKNKPYQQKLPLGLSCTTAGIKRAEQEAKIISAQLELDTFNWLDWVEIKAVVEEVQSQTIGYWVDKFTEDYWYKNTKTLKTTRSWNSWWGGSFDRLPRDADISIDILLEHIKRSPPNSKVRKRLCGCYHALAKFAKIEGAEVLLEFKGNYSPASVVPRSLPSDELIAQTITSIEQEEWRWWLGAIACYGLRPSEAFALDMEEFPVIRVTASKTNQPRIVYPLYPEWAQDWQLKDIKLPNTTETEQRTYGQRLSSWAQRHKLPFKAYDLRHCYARRCFELQIPPDRGAMLMGHQLSMHLRVYRAWIDEEYHRKFFESEEFNRFLPPN
jgi:hypothetical protein